MITDSQLTLTVGTVLGSGVSSADVINLSQRRDIGEGQALNAVFTVTTAFTGGNGAYFQIYTCDAADKTGNITQIAQSPMYTSASLTVGKVITVPLPNLGNDRYRQYIYAQVSPDGTLTGTNATTCNIVMDAPDGRTSYPSGYTVV